MEKRAFLVHFTKMCHQNFIAIKLYKGDGLLQSKYSAHSSRYLGMISINRERIHFRNQNSIFKLEIEIFQR